LRQVQEEFQNIHQEIVEEKKAREEQEEAMLEMLKEIIGKVKEQISLERFERERTEETLVNLLEETCNKLNSVSSSL
jgi:translation elongation factor EF-Ts